jgi:Fe-S-cluster-containing hydrogenase component 2
MAVCPVDCFYRTDEGVVLHDKDVCIGCGYCSYACPFGAPQFPSNGTFGLRGKMDKCTFCAGGPEGQRQPGRVREVRPQPPGRRQAAACAEMCSTKALLGGDGDVVADIFRTRVLSAARAARSGAGARPTASPGGAAAQPQARREQVMTRPFWPAGAAVCCWPPAPRSRRCGPQEGRRQALGRAGETAPASAGWKAGRPGKPGNSRSSAVPQGQNEYTRITR